MAHWQEMEQFKLNALSQKSQDATFEKSFCKYKEAELKKKTEISKLILKSEAERKKHYTGGNKNGGRIPVTGFTDKPKPWEYGPLEKFIPVDSDLQLRPRPHYTWHYYDMEYATIEHGPNIQQNPDVRRWDAHFAYEQQDLYMVARVDVPDMVNLTGKFNIGSSTNVYGLVDIHIGGYIQVNLSHSLRLYKKTVNW